MPANTMEIKMEIVIGKAYRTLAGFHFVVAAIIENGVTLYDVSDRLEALAALGRELQLFHGFFFGWRTTPTMGPMSRPDSLRSSAGA